MTTEETIALLLEQVVKINDRLDAIGDDITTLKSDVNAVNGRLDVMQDDITTLKSDVSAMQDDITIIKSDVKTIKQHMRFNRKTESDIIDYIETRIDEKLERVKQELNKPA